MKLSSPDQHKLLAHVALIDAVIVVSKAGASGKIENCQNNTAARTDCFVLNQCRDIKDSDRSEIIQATLREGPNIYFVFHNQSTSRG